MGELFDGRLANATKAGADAASSFCDFFVARSGDPLLEIDETRIGEDRVGVGIDEAGKHDLVAAVDFLRGFSNFVRPQFVGGADGSDLAIFNQDGAIFDDAEFAHLAPPPGRTVATQRKQLRGLRQKYDVFFHPASLPGLAFPSLFRSSEALGLIHLSYGAAGSLHVRRLDFQVGSQPPSLSIKYPRPILEPKWRLFFLSVH